MHTHRESGAAWVGLLPEGMMKSRKGELGMAFVDSMLCVYVGNAVR